MRARLTHPRNINALLTGLFSSTFSCSHTTRKAGADENITGRRSCSTLIAAAQKLVAERLRAWAWRRRPRKNRRGGGAHTIPFAQARPTGASCAIRAPSRPAHHQLKNGIQVHQQATPNYARRGHEYGSWYRRHGIIQVSAPYHRRYSCTPGGDGDDDHATDHHRHPPAGWWRRRTAQLGRTTHPHSSGNRRRIDRRTNMIR